MSETIISEPGRTNPPTRSVSPSTNEMASLPSGTLMDSTDGNSRTKLVDSRIWPGGMVFSASSALFSGVTPEIAPTGAMSPGT